MDESGAGIGQTAVIGERELAIGFRLIGLQNVVEVTPATASAEFQRLMTRDDINLVVASEGVRRRLSENQRIHAEGSLQPLVVFVPFPDRGIRGGKPRRAREARARNLSPGLKTSRRLAWQ